MTGVQTCARSIWLLLWTHESHAASCSLYLKAGFTMFSESPVHNYGQDLVEQEWQVEL